MNPIPRASMIILISLITLTTATAFAFVNHGNRLLVSNPEPQKIDLIFTFAGVGQRNDHTIDLVKNNFSAICHFPRQLL
jgi:hypothetical protein